MTVSRFTRYSITGPASFCANVLIKSAEIFVPNSCDNVVVVDIESVGWVYIAGTIVCNIFFIISSNRVPTAISVPSLYAPCDTAFTVNAVFTMSFVVSSDHVFSDVFFNRPALSVIAAIAVRSASSGCFSLS